MSSVPAQDENRAGTRRGRLRIGDDWNAITIIALSQSNPLKAVAEFVENAIDAHARHVTITRGREHGMHYLRIADDGEGVPRDAGGAPDFRYVATHICDSLKRRLKAQGEIACSAEGLITIADTIEREAREPSGTRPGLPGYTFERAPGELWRSRYDTERNLIVVNNAHRDFVYAARAKALKLRYIARLYAKEIVLKSFPVAPPEQLLERLLELALYTEENLR